MRQSELLKSALLDAVTHDLRTPLTSIKASVTTLLDESTDAGSRRELAVEARRDMLEVINEEADRLNGSIEKLLELARIEAGELNLRRRWGAVEEIVVNAIDRAKQLTARHKVQSSIDAGVPVVFVDAQAISEVLYTLIDNAAKYSPGGTTITLTAAPAGEGTVRLSVEDEGPGIPEGMRERVFDKFFRLTQPPTSRSQARGTGMGLAIARGIVEAHGGRIRIEGNPGTTGARVVLDLPVGDEEPTNAHAGAGLEPISAGSFAAVKKTDNQNR
jgi:two-component system sensor histidine kinase KdpD